MKVAFLGLGQMGEPMARRLLEAGHDVTVWNRTRARSDGLASAGAAVAPTPAAAASGVDVAITMLATPAAVEQVVFGGGDGPASGDALAGGMRRGQTLVEMSTIGPHAAGSIRERMPEGVDLVDAPVLGSVTQATEGLLRIFVGAPDAVLERIRPVLEAMGTVIHMGDPGAGASMKLVANSTIGAAITAVGEALALADSLGLRRDQVIEILSRSPVGPTVSTKRSNIQARSYPPNFKLRLALKDLRLVQEQASRLGLDLGIARAALAWLERAEAEGHGDEDYSAAVETITGASPRA